jgi:hypothetical protein
MCRDARGSGLHNSAKAVGTKAEDAMEHTREIYCGEWPNSARSRIRPRWRPTSVLHRVFRLRPHYEPTCDKHCTSMVDECVAMPEVQDSTIVRRRWGRLFKR